jgi:hypothetical protein
MASGGRKPTGITDLDLRKKQYVASDINSMRMRTGRLV